MSYISDCLKKFRALPPPIQDLAGGVQAVQTIQELEQRYNVKLGLLVILVTIGELRMDAIEDYLMLKYGLTEEQASDINETLQVDIFSAIKEEILYDLDLAFGIEPADFPYIRADIVDLFKTGLVDALNFSEDETTKLNDAIFYIIKSEAATGTAFEEELLKSLTANAERLTAANIISRGRSIEPTIANWLKDFIALNGTGFFDLVKLSNYVTNSPNAAKLSDGEKQLLSHLLITYRNLKFFPDTLADLPPEKWEIIPIRETGVEKKAAKPAAPEAKHDLSFLDSLDWNTLSAIEKRAVMEEYGVTEREVNDYLSK